MSVNSLKYPFSVLGFLLVISPSFSTDISGVISSNQTLTNSNSPYIVTGNVLVNASVTLTIEAGVEIRFSGNYGFLINGTLIAEGTALDSIVFTSNQTIPQAGDWNSIQFSSTATGAQYDINGNYISGNILKYCRFSYGGSTNGVIHLNGSAPYISNCHIYKSSKTGIFAETNIIGGATISNSKIKDCNGLGTGFGSGVHIRFNNSPITFINNIVFNNTGGTGIYIDGGGSVLSNNIFNNHGGNYGGGLFIQGNGPFLFEDNEIYNNSAGVGGGICTEVSNNNIIKCNRIFKNTANDGAAIFARANTIQDNIIAYNSGPNEIVKLYQSGNDNHNIGNQFFGNVSTSVIQIYGGNPVVHDIMQNTFSGNDVDNTVLWTNWSASASLTMTGNNFLDASATNYVKIQNNLSSLTIDAKSNYWSLQGGATIESKIFHFIDDFNQSVVDFSDPLTEPSVDPPISTPEGFVKAQNGSNVNILWLANNESDLLGYKVHWNGGGNFIFNNSVDVGNVTSYTIPNYNVLDSIGIQAYSNSYLSSANCNLEISWYALAQNIGTLNSEITSFTPTSAGTGTTVTITGTFLAGATAVSFGGTPAASFTVGSPTSITAVVGEGASGNVSVTTPGGTAIKSGFTFITPTWSTRTLSQARYGLAATSVGNKAFFAGGWTGTTFSNVVDIYDNSTNTWSTATLSQARRDLCAASVGSKVFFAGGWTSPGSPSNVVDIYDNSTNMWTTATLSQARTNLSATSVGTKVLFAGGYSTTDSNVVDIYDNSTNIWTTATLSAARLSLTSTSVGSKAFFAGGSSYIGNNSFDIVDIYDNNTNTWTTARLDQARNYLSATTVGTKALFGGGNIDGNNGFMASDVTDIYNNNTNSWTTTALSLARFKLAATSVGTKALFGGGNGYGNTNTSNSNVVDIFDDNTNTWSTATLSLARFLLTATSVSTKAFFAGGLLSNGSVSNVIDIYENGSDLIISYFAPLIAGVGSTVTITGANFTGATAVSFGGIPATSFTVVSSTSITAVVGAGASGNVSVTTPGGTATKSGFTFVPAPTITSFTPASGPIGTTVIITGTGFSTTPASNTVKFNGVATVVTTSSSTSLTTTVPTGATSGTISVTTTGGTATSANKFMVIPDYLPTSGLVAWFPFNNNPDDESGNGNHGVISGGVTVTSDRFGSSNSAYLFNGTSGYIDIPTLNAFQYRPITYSAWVIVDSYFPLSPGIKFRSIIGRHEGGQTNDGILGLYADQNISGGFYDNTFVQWRGGGTSVVPSSLVKPALNTWTHVVYTQDASGNFSFYQNGVLTNSGNFTETQNFNTNFRIGSGNAPQNFFWNNKIDDLGIWNRALTNVEVLQIYGSTPPEITSFTPTSAGSGTTVTIAGTNLTGATAVSFGGIPATSFTVVSSSSITAVVGAGATGSVSVTTPGGNATKSGFTFVPAPTIASFTPTSAGSGTTVTITGTSFTGATAVSFGGISANSYTVESETSITAIVGTGATGSVSVTTPGGNTLKAGFVFIPTPTISAFTPTAGPTGTSVLISGTNFSTTPANNTVKFNGVTAVVTASSATSLTTTVPTGATSGKITIEVDGQTATSLTNYIVGHVSQQGRFVVDKISGCAPLTITIMDTNLITTGECTPQKPCNMYPMVGTPPQSNQFIFTYTLSGTYSLSVLYQSVGADFITITVNDPDVTAGPSPSICPGTFAVLSSSGANTYSWSPTTGLSSVTGNTVVAMPTTTTSYTVIGTDLLGCTKTATVTVNVDNQCTIPNLVNGKELDSYRIFSIPLKLADKRIESVMSSVLQQYNGYDQEKWRLVHYSNGDNVNYTEGLSTIEEGKGYWLLSVEPVTVNIAGTPIISDFSNPFNMSINIGWNQIGNPFGFDVSWSDVLARNSGTTSIGKLFVYDPGTVSFKESDILKAWGGGFVNATSATTIQIPLTVKQISGGRSNNASEFDPNAIDQSSWFVPLRLEHSVGINDMGGIGMHKEALTGRDRYDENTLPRFIKYLELNSYHEDYFQPKFMRDVVPTSNKYKWNLVVESNMGEGDITLRWDSESLAQNRALLLLYDKGANMFLDMKRIDSHTFKSMGRRDLTVIYAIDEQHLVLEGSIGAPFPNPFNLQTTIPFIVDNDNLNVSIKIYDLLGRKVRDLISTKVNIGYHEEHWDGRDDAGDRVKPGMYIIKITQGDRVAKAVRVLVN